MGKGDIKTKRGKIAKGTFGVLRSHKKKKPIMVVTKPAKATAPKATEEPKIKKPAAKKSATKKAPVKKSAAKKK